MEIQLSNQLPPSDLSGIGYEEAKIQFQRNSNWWAVFASFDLVDFNPSPTWIARKTNVAVEEVLLALDGLVMLGLLKKEGSSFYPTKEKQFLAFDWTEKSRSEIVDEHTLVSQQILNDIAVTQRGAFQHRFFAGNHDILVELNAEIEAAFEKAFQKSVKAGTQNNSIYKITFTAANVVPAPSKQGGN